MIILRRGEISIVAVTATESGHLAEDYTFKFMHLLTKKVVETTLAAHSIGERVDVFHIDVDQFFEESDDGEYSYKLFANYPLDPPNIQLEVGIMRLIGERTEGIQYEGTPKEYVTYGGKNNEEG